jgi:hypothetical protein
MHSNRPPKEQRLVGQREEAALRGQAGHHVLQGCHVERALRGRMLDDVSRKGGARVQVEMLEEGAGGEAALPDQLVEQELVAHQLQPAKHGGWVVRTREVKFKSLDRPASIE